MAVDVANMAAILNNHLRVLNVDSTNRGVILCDQIITEALDLGCRTVHHKYGVLALLVKSFDSQWLTCYGFDGIKPFHPNESIGLSALLVTINLTYRNTCNLGKLMNKIDRMIGK